MTEKITKKGVVFPKYWFSGNDISQRVLHFKYRKKYIEKWDAEIRQHMGFLSTIPELFESRKSIRFVKTLQDIHDFMPLDNEPQIDYMLDSGGYLFMAQKHTEKKFYYKGQVFTIEKILKTQERLNPDVAVALDHPLNPTLDVRNDFERIEHTLQILEQQLRMNPDVRLFMPVVHGYGLEETLYSALKTKQLFKDYWGREPDIVGIGSMVILFRPLHATNRETTKKIKQNSKAPREQLSGSNKPYQFLVETVSLVRKVFQNSVIHVFGLGAPVLMNLLVNANALSIDSIWWKKIGGTFRGKALFSKTFSFNDWCVKLNKLDETQGAHITNDWNEGVAKQVLRQDFIEYFEKCSCGIKNHTPCGFSDIFLRDRSKANQQRKLREEICVHDMYICGVELKRTFEKDFQGVPQHVLDYFLKKDAQNRKNVEKARQTVKEFLSRFPAKLENIDLETLRKETINRPYQQRKRSK